MTNRTRAAAVLDALERGAPDVPTAYGQAARATACTPEEVAAESQDELIRAACRLREMGVGRDECVGAFCELTKGPPEAVRALIAQRWEGKGRDGVDRRTDPRQRYRRIGVICPLARVDQCNQALALAWAEPLTDSRGNGRRHPLYEKCLADNATMLGRPIYLAGTDTVVAMGLRMQATPGDIARLRQAVQAVPALFIEPQETDAQVRDAYEATVTALGWSSTPATPPEV